MAGAQGKVVKDPFEVDYERTFRNSKRDTDKYVVTAEDFLTYLGDLRHEMRRCLDASEKARDTYRMIKAAFRAERQLTTTEIDEMMKRNPKAVSAASDNIMYDRWAAKYAEIIQAEIAYANFMGWEIPR